MEKVQKLNNSEGWGCRGAERISSGYCCWTYTAVKKSKSAKIRNMKNAQKWKKTIAIYMGR
jgi:hypothetical protein